MMHARCEGYSLTNAGHTCAHAGVLQTERVDDTRLLRRMNPQQAVQHSRHAADICWLSMLVEPRPQCGQGGEQGPDILNMMQKQEATSNKGIAH